MVGWFDVDSFASLKFILYTSRSLDYIFAKNSRFVYFLTAADCAGVIIIIRVNSAMKVYVFARYRNLDSFR